MGEQFRALMALRGILFLRSLSRSVLLSRVLLVLVYGGCIVLAAFLGAGMVVAGRNIGDESAGILLISHVLVYLFCMFWLMGLFLELQRSDLVDLRRMLHLPVSLRMVFCFNFLFALISPGLFFFFFPFFGWIIGLAAHRGAMLWGIPLALAFFLALGAWTYYLRGLLAILMENKRWRQWIIALVPVVFILLVNVPNILSLVGIEWSPEHMIETPTENAEDAEPSITPFAHWVSIAVPIGWLPYGLYALHQGRWLLWALCTGGLFGLAGLGIAVGYRSTRRHYLGYGSRRSASSAHKEATVPQRPRHDSLRIPLLPEQAASVAGVLFRTIIRHPNLRVNLLMNLVVGVLLFSMFFRGGTDETPAMGGALLVLGLLLWPILGNAHLAFNLFGLDVAGFRTLMLVPTPRKYYLLGANTALMPFVLGAVVVFLAGGYFIAGLDPVLVAIAAVLGVAAFFALSLAGNAASILMAYPLPHDGMKSVRSNPRVQLTGLLSLAVVLVLALPCLFCLTLDWFMAAFLDYHGPPLGLVVAALFLGIVAGIYFATLPAYDRLFEEREKIMLETLTRDQE